MIDYKEYSRERSILRKRLERMEKAGHGTERSRAILNRIRSETVQNVRSMSEAQQKNVIMRLRGWLSMPSLSLKGQKQRIAREIERLHEIGYNKINESNFQQFAEIMEIARGIMGREAFYSVQRAEDIAQDFAARHDVWGFFEWITKQTMTNRG